MASFRIHPASIPFSAKLAAAIGLGILTFILHLLSINPGADGFQADQIKLSGLLALIAGGALLAVNFAHGELHLLFQDIRMRAVNEVALPGESSNAARFLCFAFFFGALNTGMGCAFGVEVDHPGLLFIAYFIVGFICGLAVAGIFTVVELMRSISRDPPISFDYTAPDGCGGSGFIGSALIKFGVVTLLVGVAIALYVYGYPWSKATPGSLMHSLKWGWLVFPFIMSFLVSITPAAELSWALRRYKVEVDLRLAKKLSAVRERLVEGNPGPDERATLQGQEATIDGKRKQLYKMRAWPFTLRARLEYGAIICGHAGAIYGFIQKIFG